jgi:hypothetical protein
VKEMIMKKFFCRKNNEVYIMNLLFHYLSLLNIFDAFVTSYGLEKDLIKEMNPVMDSVYETNTGLFFLIKLSLSFFLYLFIFFKVIPNSMLVKGVAIIATVLYTGVFILHCIWLFFI